MHFDTHFLEFEFLNYDNVKPLKNKFSHNLLKFDIQNMFFDMILKCIACARFIKWCPKPFVNATFEWKYNFWNFQKFQHITFDTLM
jgi:hypothetical protein